MVDDRTQRPYRASQPPVRNAPGVVAPAGPSGSDPLAELARLIGQNDPFAEYGRENGQRGAPPAAAPVQRALAYAEERYAAEPAQHEDYTAPSTYPPQQYGAPPAADNYARAPVPGFPPPDAGYEHEAGFPSNPHSGAEDHDFYDDEPPRRRTGVLAIAAIFALAVIGTAGAFGYRAVFGGSGSSGPPPVIKADSAPTKIVPAANSRDPKSGKMIYDRVADRAQGEKLVSREEQPVEMKDKPTGVTPTLGSGVIATEPKKVHTIAIRPDGSTMANAAPTAANVTPPPAPTPAATRAPAPRAAAEPPAPRQIVARAEPPSAPPPHRAAPPTPSNAPLSLSPDAPAEPAPVQRPMRAAAMPGPTQIAPPAEATPASVARASGGSGYAVQIVSRHNEAEAQASFQSLQAQFPQQLGGRQPVIRRVDLGPKGVYFRAMVGPFGSSEEANQLCSSLKAAGGACIVQRI